MQQGADCALIPARNAADGHTSNASPPHWEQRWREIITGETGGPVAAAARFGLLLLAGLYGAVIEAYRLAYDLGLLRTVTAGCRVISVGNLTVGGTGKSTTVRWIADWLRVRGVSVAVLSYGYRPPQLRQADPTRGHASSDADAVTIVSDGRQCLVPEPVSGDEPRMLAEALPGVPVLIGKRRQLSAAEAVRRFAVRCCVLDDAFQYWRLKKDLDLVLIDALCPFGVGHLLPRGLLRERPEQLRRAQALILTNAHRLTEGKRQELREQLRRLNPQAVMAEARHVPRRLYPLGERCWVLGVGDSDGSDRSVRSDGSISPNIQHPTPNTLLNGRRVLALSSLGNPEGFEETLAGLGAQVIPARYPDHYHYGAAELRREAERAEANGCEMIVTTEKDAVKIDPKWMGAVPVHVLSVGLEFDAGQEALEALLGALVA
jgi:tetraacyldisaccharide 4'-kinase